MGAMAGPHRFSPEVRERAVRMVVEHEAPLDGSEQVLGNEDAALARRCHGRISAREARLALLVRRFLDLGPTRRVGRGP